MNKLEELSRVRKHSHAKLLALKSKVYSGFLEMERAAFSPGALPKKHKELIALGISVVKNCESCMQWHIEQAAVAGACFEELFEAVEVGIEMGGGPATGICPIRSGSDGTARFEASNRAVGMTHSGPDW